MGKNQKFDVMGIDSIAVLSDDELYRKFNTVKRLIDTRRRQRSSVQELEIEFCYLVREIEIREHRKDAHTRYMEARNYSQGRRPRRQQPVN